MRDLLTNHPTLVPFVEDESRAVAEIWTSAKNRLDICIVGPSGSITVVECKLDRNPEHRRTVIGQVLDYASDLHEGGYEAFKDAWQASDGGELHEFLETGSRTTLSANLENGLINLCLAVDEIDDDLRRLIEYLNIISRESVKVTALEMTRVSHENLEILAPTVFGAELARSKFTGDATPKERWTWDSFLSAVNPSDRALAVELKQRLDGHPAADRSKQILFGVKPGGGIWFRISGKRYAVFQLWPHRETGRLQLWGAWRYYRDLRDDPRWKQFASELKQDFRHGAESVNVADLKLQQFWVAAVECDQLINSNET